MRLRQFKRALCIVFGCRPAFGVVLFLAAVPTIEQAAQDKPVRFGAKIVKQNSSLATTKPTVKILDNPDDWDVVEGEGFTGVNEHEFFLTVESKRTLPPPRVELTWPDVEIARVIGATGEPEQMAKGVRFKLHSGNNMASVKTMLDYGPKLRMAIFHNQEVRRAGHYKDGKWPANEIQSQLNFLFAAREMCRSMGIESTDDSGFEGAVHLYGFETNFPNQHVDAPPHFHILLVWPDWTGTQVTHFRLNDAGRITHNEFQVVDGKEKNRSFGQGEICEMLDPKGNKAFELIITEGGRGVIFRKSHGNPEYRLSPDSKTDSSVDAVEVHRRETPTSKWNLITTVRAEDDAENGLTQIIATPKGKQAVEETIYYDPDTGQQMETRDDGARRIEIGLKGSLQNAHNSPDSKSLLFTRWRDGYNQGRADLFVYDLRTRRLKSLVSNEWANVNLNGSAWNEKTNQIVFASDREPQDEIYMIAADGKPGSETQITNRKNHVAYEPSFSPDGKWIVFESHPLDQEGNGVIIKCRIVESGSGSDKVGLKTDGLEKGYIALSDLKGDCRQPVWSPTGEQILYQKLTDGRWDLWLVNADGTENRIATTGQGSKTDGSFSPDGKWIVYSSDGQGELKFANIYVSPVSGGKPIRITEFDGYDGAPTWSPDGKTIYFESCSGDPDDSQGTKLWAIDAPY